MNPAEQLADAILEARRASRESLKRESQRLLSERDELSQLVAAPPDLAALERRQQSLKQSVAALALQRAELERRRDELAAEVERERRRLWERFNLLCAELIAGEERANLGESFQSAMAAFEPEMKRAGVEVGRSTPALLRRQLPRLREESRAGRAWASERALEVSRRLNDSASLLEERERLEDERQRVQRESAEVLARLAAYHQAEQMSIVPEILEADVRVLVRLRREVLAPLLSDARLERGQSFAGDDPLSQLESMRDPQT